MIVFITCLLLRYSLIHRRNIYYKYRTSLHIYSLLLSAYYYCYYFQDLLTIHIVIITCYYFALFTTYQSRTFRFNFIFFSCLLFSLPNYSTSLHFVLIHSCTIHFSFSFFMPVDFIFTSNYFRLLMQ